MSNIDSKSALSTMKFDMEMVKTKYHLAQKYRLSKTRLLFIVVISHKKLYISAQIFSIGSYGTIYPLYSIGKIQMKDSYTILQNRLFKLPSSFSFITFLPMYIHFEIKFKQFVLEKSAWRHLTDLSKLFPMVTDFHMILQ